MSAEETVGEMARFGTNVMFPKKLSLYTILEPHYKHICKTSGISYQQLGKEDINVNIQCNVF